MDQRSSPQGQKLSAEDIRKEAKAYRDRQARLDRARSKAQAGSSRPETRSAPRRPKASQPTPSPRKAPAPKRRPRRRITPRGWMVLAILAFLLVGGVFSLFRSLTKPADPPPEATDPQASQAQAQTEIPGLLSASVILMDMGNGNIVYELASDTSRYPASLTKMMTVYVAVTSGEDFAQPITLTQEAFAGLYEQGAATSGFQVGEEVTFRDLLYAAMLASGGDACQALALAVSGDMDRFVDRMNEEAQDMRMDSTHFTNPTGLHDPEQTTTARDLARFLKQALGNTNFRQVFTTPTYTSTPTAVHPQGLAFQATYVTHMEEFNLHPPQDRYELAGAKTGYTPEAGLCLASLAKKNHQEYVAITLKAEGDGNNYYPVLKDTLRLYDQAFAESTST